MTELILGDCLEKMRQIKSESIDSLVTDPPAGIGFMGKSWDSHKGGRDHWIKWMSDVMRECHRVLKPGAHGLVWSLPRTSHWTATACEDAGFEIRDCVSHLFGSGFPKSLNVSKAINKAAGAEGIVLSTLPAGTGPLKCGHVKSTGGGLSIGTERSPEIKITAPATAAAKQWDGWGTALKPAVEMWWLIRKKPVIDDSWLKIVQCAEKNLSPSHAELNAVMGKLAQLNVTIKHVAEEIENLVQNGKAANGLDTMDMFASALKEADTDLSIAWSWNNTSGANLDVAKTCITLMELRQTIELKISNYCRFQSTLENIKPSEELIWLIRKPLSEKTVAANVLKWGTGGINVDGCRIAEKRHPGNYIDKKENKNETKWGHKSSDRSEFNSNQGRFPSNLVLSHSPYCTDEQCEEKIISYPIVCVGTNQLSPFDNYQTSLEFLFHVSLETRGYSKNDNDLLRNGVFSFGNADKKLSYSLLDDVLHEQLSSSALDSLDYYRTCLHFYDEQFHRVLKAAQESVPSLIDALERVYADLQQLPHSHDRRNSFSLFLWASFFISSKYYPDFITTKSNVIKESSCAIALLDEQSGNLGRSSGGGMKDLSKSALFQGRATKNKTRSGGFGDSGGASRFFYCAKTSTSERNAGLEGMKNTHPTLKSQKLMRYFCRLVTPQKGIILDPFMGSGSTGLAAKSEGFKFIGIEQNEEYFEIAKKRIK